MENGVYIMDGMAFVVAETKTGVIAYSLDGNYLLENFKINRPIINIKQKEIFGNKNKATKVGDLEVVVSFIQ